MADSKLVSLPSCKKKSRCPRPHRGAVRNWSGPAAPWVTPSESPRPMWWRAKSEKGWKVALFSEPASDGPVVRLSEWQRTQPMEVTGVAGGGSRVVPKSAAPVSMLVTAAWLGFPFVPVVVVSEKHWAAPVVSVLLLNAQKPGAPLRRMKTAKFSISEEIAEDTPAGPKFALLSMFVICVGVKTVTWSSGKWLGVH